MHNLGELGFKVDPYFLGWKCPFSTPIINGGLRPNKTHLKGDFKLDDSIQLRREQP